MVRLLVVLLALVAVLLGVLVYLQLQPASQPQAQAQAQPPTLPSPQPRPQPVTQIPFQPQPQPQPPAALNGAPKIVLSHARYDFGEVLHPREKEFNLAVRNDGNAQLNITQVKTGCGCTAAQPEKWNLAPGEATNVKVTYRSRGRKGSETSSVTILSNDPQRPEATLDLTATVKRTFELDPEHGAFQRTADPNQIRPMETRVRNLSTHPMTPELGRFATGQFEAALEEVRPGIEYVVKMTPVPPVQNRSFRDAVTLKTGVPDEPELELWASIQLVDRVNLQLPAVYFHETVKDLKRDTELEYFGDDPDFKITYATCDDPRLTLSLGPVKPSPQTLEIGLLRPTLSIPIIVTTERGATYPGNGVTVRIGTNDPEYPEIVFQVTTDTANYKMLTQQARMTSQRRPK